MTCTQCKKELDNAKIEYKGSDDFMGIVLPPNDFCTIVCLTNYIEKYLRQ